jgi:2-polyprenyl-3-methyl-5-hydroxy-6-metoxy-1,4-benzoquinol methylase
MTKLSIDSDLCNQFFGEHSLSEDIFSFGGKKIPINNGVIRFTPDISYSSGNFSKLREKHATLQLDSMNGTADRMETILSRTAWPKEFFKGKTILECGCGAGADTEVLLKLGAKVISVDIAGVDVCRKNLGDHPNLMYIQASIMDLPFLKKSFDIVWCHRVIMHTPDPVKTIDHILGFVKEGGDAFIHLYAKSWQQILS